MLFIFLFNLLFAIILFVGQPRENEANRWMITFTLSAAIGALSESILTDIIPVIKEMDAAFISGFLFQAHIYLQFLSEVISPYAIIMYSIVYSQIVNKNTKNKLSYILAIPMVVMVPFTRFSPDIFISFDILLIWAAPYFLAASFLMFYTWRHEINLYRKRSKFRVFIVLVPAWLGVFVFNYVMRAIDPNTELFRIVPVFFAIAYGFFIYYIFITGAFGIKVKIEQQQVLDKSMQIMSEGTAILNHTIKNEMSKIKFFYNLAKNSIDRRDLDAVRESIESVYPAIEGIDNMVDRIRSKTEAIILKETDIQLKGLIQKCVNEFNLICNSRGIQLEVQIETDITLCCDQVLMSEVIKNILSNAIEAITASRGIIHIQLVLLKKGVNIEISDNGIGIPKQELSRIMEPFYSTKGNVKNHGLGLSFCYKVIRAHDAEISVHSEVNQGTSVVIRFPKARILSFNDSMV